MEANQNNINREPEELVPPVETPAPVPKDAAAAMVDFFRRLKYNLPY